MSEAVFVGLEDVTKIVFEIAGEETEEFIQLEASIVAVFLKKMVRS